MNWRDSVDEQRDSKGLRTRRWRFELVGCGGGGGGGGGVVACGSSQVLEALAPPCHEETTRVMRVHCVSTQDGLGRLGTAQQWEDVAWMTWPQIR